MNRKLVWLALALWMILWALVLVSRRESSSHSTPEVEPISEPVEANSAFPNRPQVPTARTQETARVPSSNSRSGRELTPELAAAFHPKTGRTSSALDNRARIAVPGSSWMQVRGVYGTTRPVPGSDPVEVLGGIYLYESGPGRTENIVYDMVQKRYGMWTGELSLVGSRESLASITRDFDLAVIQTLDDRTTYRAGASFDFTTDYAKLKSLPGVSTIEADVTFGRRGRI